MRTAPSLRRASAAQHGQTPLTRGRAEGETAAPVVSVVVPVRNESGNIAPLVDEIAAALDARWSFEAIFVNDGSTDATRAELIALMADRPWLRQLKHDRSCGQSAAVRTGAAAARGAIVATLDGDGQNDPAYLTRLIEALMAGAPRLGLVAGQRTGRTDTGLKRIMSRLANSTFNATFQTSTRDTGCGLKAFRRDVFLALPYFDALHRFLPPLVRREGFEIAYVDVVDRPRRFGQSHYRIWDRLWVSLADLLGVLWLMKRRKRVPVVSEENPDAH
jgi:glycosyltransferase involved in cell wall biosynthesis